MEIKVTIKLLLIRSINNLFECMMLQTPAGLLSIPEFVVENMADFIIFAR